MSSSENDSTGGSARSAYNSAAISGDDGTTSVDPLADLPPRVRDFLRNADVAQPLKDLCLHILPAADFATFKRRLDRGDFDAHLTCDAHPMGGLLAQLAAAPKELGNDWLQAVAQREAFAVDALSVPYYYTGSYYSSHIKDYTGQSVSQRPLGSWMLGHRSMKYPDLAQFCARLLAHEYKANDVSQPIAHHAIYGTPTLEYLRDFADKAGTLDFINVKNANGESVFYRLATNKNLYNHASTLNVLSWLLERKPELIHTTDDAGWTALDRYVLQMTVQSGVSQAVTTESGMLRLLLASGAQFRRQTPPGMSLVDYHNNQQTTTLLGKPAAAGPIKRKP